MPLLLLALAGCRSSATADGSTATTAAPATGGPSAASESPAVVDASPSDSGLLDEAETRARTIALVQAGNFEEARARIDDLLRAQHLRAARGLLASGDPEDALDEIDHVLEVDPHDADGELLKADCSLRLAEKGIANGGGGALIEGSLQDALDFYERSAENEPRAIIGACRAATMLGDTDQALAWARRGRDQLAIANLPTVAGEPSARRTIAEAIVRAYIEAKTAERELSSQPAAEAAPAGDGAATGDTPAPDATGATGADAATGAVEAADGTGAPDADQASGASAAAPSAEQLAAQAKSAQLFGEAKTALGNLLAREADDAWAWGQLSDVLEWEGRYAEAHARLVDGLERLPDDAGLIARLARVARAEGGRELVIQAFETFEAQNPSNALAHWYLGLERFEHAVDLLQKHEYDSDVLKAAEADFVRCRELAPNNESSCKAYEVMCRDARGWCAFEQDDLPRAEREFLSMNDVLDRGIEWEFPGRLKSGVMGLAMVGDQYNSRHENLPAALAFELAHKFEMDNADWANNAGFFLRDAAEEIERDGRNLCRAASGATMDEKTLGELRKLANVDPSLAGTDAERATFRAVANQKLGLARDLMHRSWLAYRVAAELDPNDVRTVNDAGLVPVYYTHQDLDEAEKLLRRAAELGDEQVPALKAKIAAGNASEDELADMNDELFALEEAWGDAYQNLAVLEWLHKQNNEKALEYAQRSVDIGPDPRPMVQNGMIPLLRGERATGDREYFLELRNWGEGCQ